MQDVLYGVVFMGVVFGCAALILALRDKLAVRQDRSAEEGDTVSSANDPIVDFVRGSLPSVDVEADERQEPGVSEPSYHIKLPVPAGADYQFILWLGGGQKQIGARLLVHTELEYFWYMPFEEVTFRSAEELNQAFIEVVEQIMHHHTRIEQKRGLLASHFKCQFKSANGWKTVYRHSALPWISTSKIPSGKQVYQSPPLVAGC